MERKKCRMRNTAMERETVCVCMCVCVCVCVTPKYFNQINSVRYAHLHSTALSALQQYLDSPPRVAFHVCVCVCVCVPIANCPQRGFFLAPSVLALGSSLQSIVSIVRLFFIHYSCSGSGSSSSPCHLGLDHFSPTTPRPLHCSPTPGLLHAS